jgi:phage-related protein (TIGR01555 family)
VAKPVIRVQAGSNRKAFLTRDSFQNTAANLGYGTNNLTSASTYGFNPISRTHTKLEWMYRGSWLVRKIVDCPANDMTRAGIDFGGTVDPKRVETLTKDWKQMGIWNKYNLGLKWGRLYGGAVSVLMINGQDLSTPLRPEAIGRGDFKGLLVLDRWMLTASVDEFVTDFGPEFGMPKYYTTIAGGSIPSMKIHHSRVLRHEGDDVPYWQRIAENGWTVSVVEQCFDRMIAFDSASTGAAQLVYKAHLRTYKVPGLRDMIGAGGPLYQAFLDNMTLIRQAQTNEGLTIIDGDDSIEYHTNSAFSGLSDALIQFGQQLSGASGIPLVILFGQSPSGMNSTGESDIRNYYDRISSDQHAHMEMQIYKIAVVSYWSRYGEAPPAEFGFTFNPLWQQTESERANDASTIANAVTAVFDSGIIDQATAMEELKQSSHTTGIFSNITDEDIAEARANPPPPPDFPPGADGSGAPPGGGIPPAGTSTPPTPDNPPGDDSTKPVPPTTQQGTPVQPGTAEPGASVPAQPAEDPRDPPPPPGSFRLGGTPPNVKVNVAEGLAVRVNYNTGDDFKEADHPRADDGRFGSKPGSHASSGGGSGGGTPASKPSEVERLRRQEIEREYAEMKEEAASLMGGMHRQNSRAPKEDDDGVDEQDRDLPSVYDPADFEETDPTDLAPENYPQERPAAPAPTPGNPRLPRNVAGFSAEQLRPDPADRRNAGRARYVSGRLALIDAARQASNPAEAIAAVPINAHHPRLHAYRKALLSELGNAPETKAKKPPKRSEAFIAVSDHNLSPEKKKEQTAILSQKLGAPVHDMVDAIIAGFPADYKAHALVSESHGGRIQITTAPSPNDSRSYSNRCDRIFNPADKSVYHDYMVIGPSEQGKGISQGNLAGSIPAYKAAGYTRVDVFAALDVGGYAWAKYGFVPKQGDWNRVKDKAVVRLREMMRSLSPAEVASASKILSSADPRAIWALSDHPAGKKLLLGQNWHGSLNLNDPEQYNRCMNYATKAERSAAATGKK